MTNTEDAKSGPIEVWLRQRNMEVTCTIVYEDESTAELEVDSISMRGAQREMTGWFLRNGYKPVGRWDSEVEDEPASAQWASETFRRFRPGRSLVAEPSAS